MAERDDDISAQDYAEIRKQADRLLRQAGAYDRFPTPVSDIIAAARLSVDRQASLDQKFLARMYSKASGTIKTAIDKVVGLFDSRDRMIYLDLTAKEPKQRFVSLHETGHGYLPWQKDLYALMEDGDTHLDPDIEQQFESQASAFASELLFQVDRFTKHADGLPFELNTPLKLASKYGASAYATIRRFVGKSHRACAVLIFEQPTYEVGRGYAFQLRRCIMSPSFESQFGRLSWPPVFYTNKHDLAAKLPLAKFKRKFTKRCRVTSPLGSSEVLYLEAFDSTFHVFALVFPEGELQAIKLAANY